MRYGDSFKDAYLADAYERMFLNAALGESALFVSAPEIKEAWRIFTPLLHAIDAAEKPPVVYPFGLRNPYGFKDWSKKYGGAPILYRFRRSMLTPDTEVRRIRG